MQEDNGDVVFTQGATLPTQRAYFMAAPTWWEEEGGPVATQPHTADEPDVWTDASEEIDEDYFWMREADRDAGRDVVGELGMDVMHDIWMDHPEIHSRLIAGRILQRNWEQGHSRDLLRALLDA